MSTFALEYLSETAAILDALDRAQIDAVAEQLAAVRDRAGGVFVLGNGGSAANASHFVNDLRKVLGVEAYAPTDNVAELTARANDDGWETTFEGWLRVSGLSPDDLVVVLSVGGGDVRASPNIVRAVRYARDCGAPVVGIVGAPGGATAQVAAACVLVDMPPPPHVTHSTPHVEEVQSVLCHLLVWHPRLREKEGA